MTAAPSGKGTAVRLVYPRLGRLGVAGFLVLAQFVPARSWLTSREPARWNFQLGTGVALVPFEEAWITRTPKRFEADLRDGWMPAMVLRGGGGWVHPSGRWGADALVEGGTRIGILEPEENQGSFVAGSLAFRWDPFAVYQFAPFCGALATLSSVREQLLVGATSNTFFGDPEEAWGMIERHRKAVSLGVSSGLRFGWLEGQLDVSWPVLSTETHRGTAKDPAWTGHFAPAEVGPAMVQVLALRIPIHALDGGQWGERSRASFRDDQSRPKPHTFAMGMEGFWIPPAMEFQTGFDEIVDGPCYGVHLRWDLASGKQPGRGFLIGLYQAMNQENSGESGVSGRLMVIGGEAGVWWDPFAGKSLPLRTSATMGVWNATASADPPGNSQEAVLHADWWGVRLSAGGRVSLGLVYGGGHLDADLVRPGDATLGASSPSPRRTGALALSGGWESGLEYRF